MPEHFQFRVLYPDMHKRFMQCRSMHIMASIFISIYALRFLEDIQENWLMLLMILPISVAILFFTIFKKEILISPQNNRTFRIIEIGFLFMGGLHFLNTNQYFPMILFFTISFFLMYILYMELRIFSEMYIQLSSDFIVIPTPTQDKKIKWNQLHQIQIKNEHISFFFKSNEINQYRIVLNMNSEELLAFQTFCKNQIDKS
ncbi:MAG TPA: hypothetical protein PKA54_02220 [Chitinophagaceae bacterium]|nr:MAG: hypothetical protein UZ11_BCD004001708 [Bacteroidetes bacterium OLB11]HMN32170.1 hypothetical protein [Chitinophagaceae bacterium]